MCLFWELVAGLLRPRPSLEQIAQSSKQWKVLWAQHFLTIGTLLRYRRKTHYRSCAAEAIFYCPTMTSHRPKSQNTPKEQALIPEKETRRAWPRCHVSLEKSSKNHKPLEKWAKPNLSPDVTPRPANFFGEYFRRICHVVSPDPPELFAVFSRHSGWPK